MARSITVSEIPDAVYERLQEDAQEDGVSVAELVRQELIERTPEEQQIPMDDWLDLVAQDEPANLPPGTVVAALHAGRAEHY